MFGAVRLALPQTYFSSKKNEHQAQKINYNQNQTTQ